MHNLIPPSFFTKSTGAPQGDTLGMMKCFEVSLLVGILTLLVQLVTFYTAPLTVALLLELDQLRIQFPSLVVDWLCHLENIWVFIDYECH
jgi:hypothetical protein